MTFRWIILIAVGLALSSCSQIRFPEPSREFSGVWLYEFEGSSFVEGATQVPATRPPYRRVDWLQFSYSEPRLDPLIENATFDDARNCQLVQPIRITFFGRRTYRPFGAGHMGLWRSEVTVDRVVAMERLGSAICYPSTTD